MCWYVLQDRQGHWHQHATEAAQTCWFWRLIQGWIWCFSSREAVVKTICPKSVLLTLIDYFSPCIALRKHRTGTNRTTSAWWSSHQAWSLSSWNSGRSSKRWVYAHICTYQCFLTCVLDGICHFRHFLRWLDPFEDANVWRRGSKSSRQSCGAPSPWWQWPMHTLGCKPPSLGSLSLPDQWDWEFQWGPNNVRFINL
jgi:hypothetical protein